MLKSFRLPSLTLALGAALFTAAAVPTLRAQGLDNDFQTTVTFDSSVNIGGNTVPAGTYVFRLLDQDPYAVEVMNSDRTHLFAIVPVNSAQAPAPYNSQRIELKESAAGAPPVVHKWFYPGETVGWEFPDRARD